VQKQGSIYNIQDKMTQTNWHQKFLCSSVENSRFEICPHCFWR